MAALQRELRAPTMLPRERISFERLATSGRDFLKSLPAAAQKIIQGQFARAGERQGNARKQQNESELKTIRQEESVLEVDQHNRTQHVESNQHGCPPGTDAEQQRQTTQ